METMNIVLQRIWLFLRHVSVLLWKTSLFYLLSIGRIWRGREEILRRVLPIRAEIMWVVLPQIARGCDCVSALGDCQSMFQLNWTPRRNIQQQSDLAMVWIWCVSQAVSEPAAMLQAHCFPIGKSWSKWRIMSFWDTVSLLAILEITEARRNDKAEIAL